MFIILPSCTWTNKDKHGKCSRISVRAKVSEFLRLSSFMVTSKRLDCMTHSCTFLRLGKSSTRFFRHRTQTTSSTSIARSRGKNFVCMQIFHSFTNGTTSTASTDTVPINHFHFGSVDSTQNKCQEIIQTYYREGNEILSADPSAIWAVTASEQTQGRGTSQRSWTSIPGNMFLTVAVPMDLLQLKIRTILPLKIGTILVSCVQDFLQSRTTNAANSTTQAAEAILSLKWPNDVLLNDCKVAGVLIESFSTVSNSNNQYIYYFLIGIGVNVAHTPTIFDDGRNARTATCLADYCCVHTVDGDFKEDDTAVSLAMSITNHIHQWLSHLQQIHKNSEGEEEEQYQIIHSWERWAQPWMGKKTYIRDQTTNNVIIPLGIQLDGQLKVQYVSNNNSNYHQVGLLPMTDYLL